LPLLLCVFIALHDFYISIRILLTWLQTSKIGHKFFVFERSFLTVGEGLHTGLRTDSTDALMLRLLDAVSLVDNYIAQVNGGGRMVV
jgi:hypothetical protein